MEELVTSKRGQIAAYLTCSTCLEGNRLEAMVCAGQYASHLPAGTWISKCGWEMCLREGGGCARFTEDLLHFHSEAEWLLGTWRQAQEQQLCWYIHWNIKLVCIRLVCSVIGVSLLLFWLNIWGCFLSYSPLFWRSWSIIWGVLETISSQHGLNVQHDFSLAWSCTATTLF